MMTTDSIIYNTKEKAFYRIYNIVEYTYDGFYCDLLSHPDERLYYRNVKISSREDIWELNSRKNKILSLTSN